MGLSPPPMHAVLTALHAADLTILVYFLMLNSFYALLLILSIPELGMHWWLADDEQLSKVLGADSLPPISILVPAYNEAVTIADSILSFLTLQYPRHEVVLVNDGSTDGTLEQLIRRYDLYAVPCSAMVSISTERVRSYYRSRAFSKLTVVDKENGGKADSLNAAVNAARYPYVLAVDADTLIEPDALPRLARPFVLGRNVTAVGGTVRVVNACRIEHGRVVRTAMDTRWLPGIQTVEYLRAFLFGRLGWNRLGGSLIISGAFGLFDREQVLAVGGYRTSTVGEDMDLVVRLRRHLRRAGRSDEITFIPDPVAWTEVPTSVKVLARQRERWHRGLIDVLWQNRGMLFNPRYGKMGMLAYPFFVFGEMLSPIVEVLGYMITIIALYLGAINSQFAWLFFFVAFGYGTLLSFWAIVLEEFSFRRYPSRRDLLLMVRFALLESFGYRQLTVWFRLQAFWKYLQGDRRWGRMHREGFAAKDREGPTHDGAPAASPHRSQA